MGNNVSIDGAVITPKMIEDIKEIQEAGYAELLFESLEKITDFVLSDSYVPDAIERIDMVVTLRNLAKYVRTMTGKESKYEQK